MTDSFHTGGLCVLLGLVAIVLTKVNYPYVAAKQLAGLGALALMLPQRRQD